MAIVPAWRNRIIGSGDVEPEQLLANPKNWRTHPGRQRDALRGSLAEVGWVQQVLVNQRTGYVIDGHARIEEAISAGAATVPVLYVDLEPEEEALVLATLDPIAAMAGQDDEIFRDLVDGISVTDAGLLALLEDLGGMRRRPGRTDPDDAPPLGDAANVQRGDLFALGEHRLLCGDATDRADVERLMGTVAADVVWTDPPYGVAVVGRTEDHLTIENDDLSPTATRELIASALRAAPLRPGGVFYIAAPGGPALLPFLLALGDAAWQLRQTIVWAKDRFVLGHSDFHYRHENVLVGEPSETAIEGREAETIAYGWADGAGHLFRGDRRLDTVWDIPRPSASREHPTMKPVELVARGLEYSSLPGQIVYDPFAGSGTTVIAAEQLGRRCFAVDVDPRYVAVTIKRWEDFTGQTAERLA